MRKRSDTQHFHTLGKSEEPDQAPSKKSVHFEPPE